MRISFRWPDRQSKTDGGTVASAGQPAQPRSRMGRGNSLPISAAVCGRAALDEALALARSTGAASYEPLIRVELARLAGDEDRRQRELREAHRLFTEMGATVHAERLAKELGC